jgi:RNA polymerase sigma factor FliA
MCRKQEDGTRGATTVSGTATTSRTGEKTLVEEHLYLVTHIVNGLSSRYPRHVDRNDLWSAGAAGLVEAAHRYDPDTGVPFARYAAIRIRGSIIDSTRTRDWATRRLRRDLRELQDGEASFEAEHGRSPNDAELAEHLDLEPDAVAARRAAGVSVTLLQLDRPVDEGSDAGTLSDTVVEEFAEWLPDAALEQREMVGTVRTAISHLNDVQREVIERYFFGGEYLRDIADSLGVTEARVSQIRAEALNAVRAYFGTLFDAVPEVPASAPGVRSRASYVSSLQARSWRSRMSAAEPTTPQTQARYRRNVRSDAGNKALWVRTAAS